MFFLNFLVFFHANFHSNLVLKFRYFPEFSEKNEKKRLIIKKFFSSKIEKLCHSFRYSFPLKTTGALIMGGETFLDCVFETKFRVEIENCESDFFIGRFNIKKGTFVAVNFPYKMEKFVNFSNLFITEKNKISLDFPKIEMDNSKNFDYLFCLTNLPKKRKNSFSLCWSNSKISSALHGFFFGSFSKSNRKIFYFKKIKFKDRFISNKSHFFSIKKYFLKRLCFHVVRSSYVPLKFPFKLFKEKKKEFNIRYKIHSVLFKLRLGRMVLFFYQFIGFKFNKICQFRV